MADPMIGKRTAAEAAVQEVRSGMTVGLGTGTTAAFAIDALGARQADGLSVAAVATSLATAARARSAGLVVLDLDAVAGIDIAIDGADEIDPQLRAIKGGGGAMLREKIVAAAARRMICIVDGTKCVDQLGARPVPVEVLPFAAAFVAARVAALGGRSERRMAGDRPFLTDQGNAILDCRFERLEDPRRIAAELSSIPGMLGHGLFIDEIDALYVGNGGEVTIIERSSIASTNGAGLV